MKYYKNVIEDRIDYTNSLMTKDQKKLKTVKDLIAVYYNTYGTTPPSNIILDYCYQAVSSLENFDKFGSKHFVMSKLFYKALESSSKRTKLNNVPAIMTYSKGIRCYQVTIPDGDKYIIRFSDVVNGEFNIFVYVYKDMIESYNKNEHDMYYFILRCNEGDSCQDVIDFFIKTRTTDDKNNTLKLDDELLSVFPVLVNIMLYINNGEPDLREFKPGSIKSKAILRGIKNHKTHTPYTMVGFSFKKETLVNSFFRWQAYGPNHSLRRYQLIPGFARGGKD